MSANCSITNTRSRIKYSDRGTEKESCSTSSNNTSTISIPSTSSLFVDNKPLTSHIFYEGKVVYKKRKEPEEKVPFMISARGYRKYLLDKETKTNKKRKTNKNDNEEDWQCCYCSLLYSEEVKKRIPRTWIECDKCTKQMHVSCVPNRHLINVHYDKDASSSNVEFTCESCYVSNSDSD